MAYDFIKLGDVEAVKSLNETAKVLVEQDGEIKRIPKNELGGIKIESSAEAGQAIVVKEVDATGAPTEWETKNIVESYDDLIDKPFYEKNEYEVCVPEQNITFTTETGESSIANIPNINLPWDILPYRLTFDGIEYEAFMYDNADYAWLQYTLNDGSYLSFYAYGHIYIDSVDYVGDHVIKLELKHPYIKTIEEKYLSFPAYAGKQINSFGDETSICFNSEENITSDQYSVAEGAWTVAADYACHAEGYLTATYAPYSHVEGRGTINYARSAHVGGQYNICHAYLPTQKTINFTENLGRESETYYYAYDYSWDYNTGTYTLINPILMTGLPPLNTYIIKSQPSGSTMYFNTNGVSRRYHSNLNYYLYDINSGHIKHSYISLSSQSNMDSETPLMIIGNGSSDYNRSNAYILDTGGNGWYSGDVFVGSNSGTNKDEGSKKLATEEYVDTAIALKNNELILTSSTTGSTKQFKITVNDEGVLTATEVI